MPALVDNPNPSLTYTFCSGMTPLSYPSTNIPTTIQTSSSNPPSPLTPDDSITHNYLPMSHSRSHGKRRDPSYIPRPSNAFILFRSAFIRDRKVSDKVEGNHSSLSKIIGHSWKKLSPEEREKWEAEAVAAQAQHRAMYPDWRFRPGANALAKLKIKDGGTTTRRRSAHVKEPPDDAVDEESVEVDQSEKGRGKGKGRNKSSARILSLEEMRCAKIADFVADGIRGEELEVAVKQWEGDRKMGREKSQRPRLSRTQGASSSTSTHSRSHSYTTSNIESSSISYPSNPSPDSSSNPPQNPQLFVIDPVKPALDNSGSLPSGVPLTHMFKRSLSAPASHTDLPSGPISPSEPSDDSSADDLSPYTTTEPRSGSWDNYSPLVMQVSPTGTHSHVHERRDSNSFPMPSGTNTATSSFDASQQHLTWQDAENQRRIEEMQEPNSWWGDSRSAEVEPSTFGYHGADQRASGITEIGYENCGGTQFDGGYVEYGSFDSPHDASQNVEWTDLSNNTDRHGLVTVLDNPYKDSSNPNSPHTLTPPTIYAPPLSNSYYYAHQVSPTSSLPPSSFSTLTGWAGDYKTQTPTWPDPSSTSAPPSSSSSTSSSNWYSPEGSFNWNGGRFEHGHCPTLDSQDWDRLEYRTATDLQLNVEPLRPMTFHDEIRRMHGNSP